MAKKAAAPTQDEIAEHEQEVVDGMIAAREFAAKLFGAQTNHVAVEEIYDWMIGADDADDLAADIERAVEHAKKVYETTTPTPEQVFGVFDRINPAD